VIHFAASKAVGESVENPLLYYENISFGLHFAGITTKNEANFILVPLVRFMVKPKRCRLLRTHPFK
jgi:hypothetical protein